MRTYFLFTILVLLIFIGCKNTATMQSTISLKNKSYKINLEKPLDISLPVMNDAGVGAWYIDQPQISHVEVDGYVGKVTLGGSTNFNNVHFNPHSHGTHTECIGHITRDFYSVNNALDRTFFKAQLITPQLENINGDQVITLENIGVIKDDVEAVILRTLPNEEQTKKRKNYSNSNPPYVQEAVMLRFRESGIIHMLIDLPSVDKEKDNGALLAHKAFWDYDGEQRHGATITELIYVDDAIADGLYILDLQVAPMENDAAPSRPILYKIEE